MIYLLITKNFGRWPRLGELYGYLERNGVVIDYANETKMREKFTTLIKKKLKEVRKEAFIRKSFRDSFISTLKDKATDDAEKNNHTRLFYLILEELMSYFLDDKEYEHIY